MITGRAMTAVASYVQTHPGCSPADVRRVTGCSYADITQAWRSELILYGQPDPSSAECLLYPPIEGTDGPAAVCRYMGIADIPTAYGAYVHYWWCMYNPRKREDDSPHFDSHHRWLSLIHWDREARNVAT